LKEIFDESNSYFKGHFWKMIEHEPGVYKIQSLATKGYLQITKSADRVIEDDQTTGAYD
jgi:hypothetical protein